MKTSNSPISANDNLELAASLTVQNIYDTFGDKGGRYLVGPACEYFAKQAGFEILKEDYPKFQELCQAKWLLIMQAVNLKDR